MQWYSEHILPIAFFSLRIVYSIDEDTDTPIVIRNLDCNGATSLEACRFEVLTAATCTHSQDAALECGKYGIV